MKKKMDLKSTRSGVKTGRAQVDCCPLEIIVFTNSFKNNVEISKDKYQ